MAVLMQCPYCHKKQKLKNKLCKCGADMDKLKRQKKKVKFWISYFIPQGKDDAGKVKYKQRWECVGYSIKEAHDADGKRRSQKRENRIFDMLPANRLTLAEIIKWYLDLKTVKKNRSYNRIVIALNKISRDFGHKRASDITLSLLENYQLSRLESVKPATVDYEMSITKTMIKKAVYDKKVSADTLIIFDQLKRKLVKGSNERERTITIDEYLKLYATAHAHLKPLLKVARNTGMRVGEIRTLKWQYIDREKMFIRLPAEAIKEGEKTQKGKSIPINHNVKAVLDSLPRALHHDYVFTYRGQPISGAQGTRRAFMTTCKNAGIPYGENGIRFADFRRTVKTDMVAAGVDKVYRDVILGHSLKGMDAHYIKPSEEDLTAAMEQYTAWLDEQLAAGQKQAAVG